MSSQDASNPFSYYNYSECQALLGKALQPVAHSTPFCFFWCDKPATTFCRRYVGHRASCTVHTPLAAPGKPMPRVAAMQRPQQPLLDLS